jgi:hypothetical protein
VDEIAVNNYLAKHDIFSLFCKQLEKDFEGAGVGSAQLADLESDPKRVREIVLGAVRHLSRQSSQQLPSLLYRVDISEKKLREFADKNQQLSFEEVVSELIVRRVLQKVILKKKFSNG